MSRRTLVGRGGVVDDRSSVMSRGWVVRVSDVSDFLMDEAVVTVMRITDMSYWSMSLSNMMSNMRGLNRMSLRSLCCFVVLSSRLFLLSKHQVMYWLIMVHSNWLEDDFMLRSFFTVLAMRLFMAREVFVNWLRFTVMESWGLNRCLHLFLFLLMSDICRFMA